MRPSNAAVLEHEGNLVGEEILMGLDTHSLVHIQSILSNIYSDPELAVIREYASNALDSHRAAGIDDPIEIFLPNELVRTYVVRDHGVGMSRNEIAEQFTLYGWSSKRETDDETGMLGIGCKSGLAYGEKTFTFVATKDGERTTALVSQNHLGCGVIKIAEVEYVDEPNGVEVRIPVNDYYSFNDRAQWFFGFWDEGTVLINGQPPEQRWGYEDEDLELDPDVHLSNELEQDYIVQGNVPYEAGARLSRDIGGGYRAVVRVDIGTVDFTPSREQLQYSDRTLEVVRSAREYIEENLQRRAAEEVAASATKREALEKTLHWQPIVRGKLSYDGEYVPLRFTAPLRDEVDEYGRRKKTWFLTWDAYGHRGWSSEPANTNKQTYLDADKVLGSLQVVGMPITTSGVRKEIKAFVRKWLEENTEISDVIFTNRFVGDEWTEGVPVLHWDDLVAMIPRKERTYRKREKYRYVANNDGLLRESAYLPNGRKVWIGTWETFSRGHLRQLFGQGVKILVVDKNRVNKFRRENPKIVHARQYAALRACRAVNKVTPLDSWKRLQSRSSDWSAMGLWRLPTDEINDVELVKLIGELGDGQARGLEFLTTAYAIGNIAGVNVYGLLPEPDTQYEARVEAMAERYPLASEILGHGRRYDEFGPVIDYVNAIYYYKGEPQC